MNKLFTKVAALSVGLAMAIGVGVGLGLSATPTKEVKAAGGTFEKITSLSALTSGSKYLIVSETDNVAFNGSLSTIDAVSNTQSVTISSNKITTTSDFYFTITSKSGGYSIKGSGGKYIGSTADKNELLSDTTDKYTNTITWDSTNSVFIIKGSSSYLVFNSTSGQTRFRYFKSGTCNSGIGTGAYHPVSLFKESSGGGKTLSSIAVSGTMTKTSYTTADSWDPTGLVVTGTYSDSSTDNTLASSATFAYYSNSAMTASVATPNDLGTGTGKTVYIKATVSGVSNAAGYGQSVDISAPSYTDVLGLNGETVYIKTSDGNNYMPNSITTTNSHPSVVGVATAQAFDFILVGNNTYTIQASGGTYDGYYLTSNGSSGSSNRMSYSTTSYSWKGSADGSDLLLQDASNNYLTCYSETDWRCYTNRQSTQKDVLVFPDASSVTTYTISFDAGSHATGTKASTTSSAGDYTLPDYTGFTPDTGYVFTGWKANDTGSTLAVGSTYSISADVTFYAQWVLGVGLSYDANTGGGTMETTYVVSGGTQTVAACTFTAPSGKVFAHWNTSSDDQGTSYNAGATITNYTTAITLYAIWEETTVYTLVTDPSTLTDGTTFVLVGYASSTYRIASGLNSDHEKMNAITAATSISDGVNEGSTLITSEADVFTLVSSQGSWEIKRGNTYLQFTGGSNGNDSFTDTSSANTKFTISGDATIDIISDAQTGRYWRYNTSTGDLRNGDSGYGTNIYMFALLAPEREITNSRMTAGSVSAKTGDTTWTIGNDFAFEVLYDGDSEYTDVTSRTTFNVTESVPVISADGSMQVTVTPVFNEVTYTAKAATVIATLTFVDFSIGRLYDIELESGATTPETVTFDGVYMGCIERTSSGNTVYDIYVGNGDYGMLVYGLSTVSSYVYDETYLTVTGYMKNYNGLYEVTKANSVDVVVSELSSSNPAQAARIALVETPNTYVVTGGEQSTDYQLASRKTSISGTITKIGNDTTAGHTATSNSNNSVYVSVGGNDVLLYVKAAQATAEVAAKFVIGQNITADGYSTFYNGFQVAFTSVIDPDANYHAADFARNLLKLTMGLCNASYSGANNKSALTSIWTTLAGADHWLKVQANGETSALINGTPDSSIVVPTTEAGILAMSDADAIGAALYRYDFCTAKYNLSNFMKRTLTVSFSSRISIFGNLGGAESNTILVVIVASVLCVAGVGGYFFLRRKKEQ